MAAVQRFVFKLVLPFACLNCDALKLQLPFETKRRVLRLFCVVGDQLRSGQGGPRATGAGNQSVRNNNKQHQ